MKELNRVKDLINKIDNNDFKLISEQAGLMDVVGKAGDLVGDLWGGAKDMLSNGAGFITDKVSGVKILKISPFKGNLGTVINSSSKLFNESLKKTNPTTEDMYNALVILDNLYEGTVSGGIKDKDGNDFKLWEVFESFTVGVYNSMRGQSFDYNDMWTTWINEDDIDECAEEVSSKVSTSVKYEVLSTNKGEEIKDFLVSFFLSGKSMSALWNDDRLDGDWNFTPIKFLLTGLDMSKYEDEGQVMSQFEIDVKSVLPCYLSAKFKFIGDNDDGSGKKQKIAVRKEDGLTTVMYFKNGTLTASMFHTKRGNKTPVAVTSKISCNGSGGGTSNFNLNESILLEQQPGEPTTFKYGEVSFTIEYDQWEVIRDVMGMGGKENDPTDNTTTNTTTIKSDNTKVDDTKVDDSGEKTITPTTNIGKLKVLMISKGLSEDDVNDDNIRGNWNSVGVSAKMGQNISTKEYLSNEEDIYAEQAIEAINRGILKFSNSGESNFEQQEKKEEKIINVVTKIAEPTPIEVKAIEEVGEDAVAKSNNQITFDKNRIKTVRVTSNESKVVYIATEEITDIINDIENQLESVFGGDWMLDRSGNKFMSKNKIYVFKKK